MLDFRLLSVDREEAVEAAAELVEPDRPLVQFSQEDTRFFSVEAEVDVLAVVDVDTFPVIQEEGVMDVLPFEAMLYMRYELFAMDEILAMIKSPSMK